jgi:hypothetical protein
MRNDLGISVTVIGLLAALFAASSAAGQAPRASGIGTYSSSFYYFCRSDMDVNGKFYFSQIAVAAPGISPSDLQQSFQAFLVSKYGYPRYDSASCPFGNQDVVVLGRKQTIDNLHNAKYTVEDVNFTYAPVNSAPAAAPPPAQPPPTPPRVATPVVPAPGPTVPPARVTPPSVPRAAAPPAPPRSAAARPTVETSRYILCYGNAFGNGKDTYYSEPVEVSQWDTTTVQEHRAAFAKVLRERYKLMFNVRCVTPKNLDDVNKSKQIMGTNHNLIATGWKQ